MPNEPDWNAMAEDLHVIRRYLGWIILLLLLPFLSAIVIARSTSRAEGTSELPPAQPAPCHSNT